MTSKTTVFLAIAILCLWHSSDFIFMFHVIFVFLHYVSHSVVKSIFHFVYRGGYDGTILCSTGLLTISRSLPSATMTRAWTSMCAGAIGSTMAAMPTIKQRVPPTHAYGRSIASTMLDSRRALWPRSRRVEGLSTCSLSRGTARDYAAGYSQSTNL